MTQTYVKNLIGELHDQFGDQLTSPQQQKLMQDLRNHMHKLNDADPADPDFEDTLNILLQDLETEHPQAAGFVRQIIEALNNMGI